VHTVEGNESLQVKYQVRVAEDARYSRPYWRRRAGADRYDLDIPAFEGLPWSPPEVLARLGYRLEGVAARLEEPAIARYPGHWVGGERQRVIGVVPALSVQLTPAIVVFPAAVPARRELRASVLHNGKDAAPASLRLELPVGWKAVPSRASLSFRLEGDEDAVRFQLTPPPAAKPGEVEVRAVASAGGREFREGYRRIAYDHIQERAFFEPAAARVKVMDIRVPAGVSVGYVMGAGDEVPNALVQLGIPVTLLGEDALTTGDLGRYTTILTGIRAYQARPDLRAHNQRLIRYAEEGGNLVLQYNGTDFNYLGSPPSSSSTSEPEKLDSPFAPYPGVSVGASRVTDETAPMTLLVPGHPLLTYPNRIRARDWEGWVQERGVNFLDVHDARYRDLLASADPFPENAGEKRGILVDAQVGKGRWTYVALSLFRQLPAGTDGAYRLLANLVARPRGR
jgi:hypothetical protein